MIPVLVTVVITIVKQMIAAITLPQFMKRMVRLRMFLQIEIENNHFSVQVKVWRRLLNIVRPQYFSKEAKMNSKIANAIRTNDKKAYQEARYPRIQDGEWVVFIDEDFSGVDFEQFSLGFFVFIRCKLDRAKNLCGQPIIMIECSAEGLDLRDQSLITYACMCNFKNMKYDTGTRLIYANENNDGHIDASSSFVDCRVDNTTRHFLKNQGILINMLHKNTA